MYDLLKEILESISRNKLRTALTGFAVAWGIFMLIFLLGAGNGLINAMTQSSNRYMDNSMMVYGGWTQKAYRGMKEGRSVSINDGDASITRNDFKENIDDVGMVFDGQSLTISLADQYITASISGVTPIYQAIQKLELVCGRFINDIDLRERRKVLVLSSSQAKELGQTPNQLVGRYVKAGDMMFRVVGVSKQDESRFSSDVYGPFTTVRTIYGGGNNISKMAFSFHGLPSEKANEDFEQRYRARLNTNHDVAPDDEGAFWLWNRFMQNMQMEKGMGMVRIALWIVGLFTLLSGVVGVSNIMLISVRERTHEFGIRKAIGATPASILRNIIVESVLITAFFGYIGMLLGIAANAYMDATVGHTVVDSGLFQATMFVNPTVGLDVCLQATLTLIVAGTLAGLAPARRAATIRPIEALRAE